jgi:hypothetical protein
MYLVGIGALGVDPEPIMQSSIVDSRGDAGADRMAIFRVDVPEQEHVAVQQLADQVV